jgi:hypothetical protein
LQRLRNQLRAVVHPQHPWWATGRGEHLLESFDEASGGDERSTTCSSDSWVCSSIIDAILTALPSTAQSNWKSIAEPVDLLRISERCASGADTCTAYL